MTANRGQWTTRRRGPQKKKLDAFGDVSFEIPEPAEDSEFPLTPWGREIYYEVCEELRDHGALDHTVVRLVRDYAAHRQEIRLLYLEAKKSRLAGDQQAALEWARVAESVERYLNEGLGRELCQTPDSRSRLPSRPGAAARGLAVTSPANGVVDRKTTSLLDERLSRS